MVIKSISLENFQCDHGSASKNCFEFGEGLNIIIGVYELVNPKFMMDFIGFCLIEYLILLTELFSKTSEVKRDLISDKAKFEAKKEGNYVKTE